jgi:inorganic pyrophosphatase
MSLADLAALRSDGAVHVVVESPRGSSLKLKYDPQRELFELSRPLIKGLTYPYDWGFIPSTTAADGDPLDAMVLWDETSFPGLVLACRLVAVLGVEQNSKQHPGTRERNDRLLAVPVAAPLGRSIQDLGDLPVRLREELEAFFMASTVLEGKDLKFLGWSGKTVALEVLDEARSAARR